MMKVFELINLLQTKPRQATPYVQITDPETGAPLLVAVTGIADADSPAYGSAVIIELED
jgi:hypothetical protein